MEFAKIVPFLTHPLALIGYVLFLFFSIHRILIKSGILKPLTESDSSRVVVLILRYGFLIALAVIAAGFSLEAVERLSPSKKVASFAGIIDSYEKAAAFSKFIHDNEGKAVYVKIMAEQPYWSESDCDFLLRTDGPEDPNEAASFNSMSEQYCIQDARGAFANPFKPSAGYVLTFHRNYLRFEGFFSVLGDIEGGNRGMWSVGLIPLSREFGHDRKATNR